MDFEFDRSTLDFRAEVIEFFEARVTDKWTDGPRESPEYLELGRALDKELIDRGWYTMHWPREFGGHGDMMRYGTLRELEGYYRAPTYGGHGRFIVGPALLKFGTEEQRRTFLPPIAAGELTVCQGFSEAEAGSDLSAMRATAVPRGRDTYVVNGTKLYVTFGCYANAMLLAAKTDTSAPRHNGMSLFLIDMPLPGMEIRPLVCLTGHEVAEIHFDDVEVPADRLLGEPNRGFYHMTTALNYERAGVDRPARMMAALEDVVTEAKRRDRWGTTARTLAGELAAMLEAWRAIAWRVIRLQARGEVPSWEASLSQYYRKECNPLLGELVLEAFGIDAVLEGGGPLEFLVREAFNNHGQGGRLVTRNVIGRRGMKLPG
ncbi:acyl-CoA dehydrogenase family protein [Actinophytocola sp.]|uniref:acyl-CoA dehydrogenase family protein n=1 Tax=Actinophytocola sp. TaxID=1872138 RepID=UPI003D6AF12B